MYVQIAILFCSVFLSFLGALTSQNNDNMCLGHAVQITSGTDHMAHEMGGKIVRKGTQIHQESMTRTSPRKDMRKSNACLESVSEINQKWCPKGWAYICSLPLCAAVAALALQSSSRCKKCCQRAPKMTMKWQKWLQNTVHGRASVSKTMQKSKNLARRTARSALN